MRVSSRSSTNFLMNGWFIRAVTFQSIARTSSPGWYSRTSSKFMPWPLKTEWYWPASVSVTMRLVRNSICRIFLRISRGIMRLDYWEDLKENFPSWAIVAELTQLVSESTRIILAKSPVALEFYLQRDDVMHELWLPHKVNSKTQL